MKPVALFFEVGSDTAIKFEIRATSARNEHSEITKKLQGGVSTDEEKRLMYRKKVLEKKHPWLKI